MAREENPSETDQERHGPDLRRAEEMLRGYWVYEQSLFERYLERTVSMLDRARPSRGALWPDSAVIPADAASDSPYLERTVSRRTGTVFDFEPDQEGIPAWVSRRRESPDERRLCYRRYLDNGDIRAIREHVCNNPSEIRHLNLSLAADAPKTRGTLKQRLARRLAFNYLQNIADDYSMPARDFGTLRDDAGILPYAPGCRNPLYDESLFFSGAGMEFGAIGYSGRAWGPLKYCQQKWALGAYDDTSRRWLEAALFPTPQERTAQGGRKDLFCVPKVGERPRRVAEAIDLARLAHPGHQEPLAVLIYDRDDSNWEKHRRNGQWYRGDLEVRGALRTLVPAAFGYEPPALTG